MTYREDKPVVAASLAELVRAGIYPANLRRVKRVFMTSGMRLSVAPVVKICREGFRSAGRICLTSIRETMRHFRRFPYRASRG